MEEITTRTVKGPRCQYQLIKMAEEHRAALDEALKRREITGKAIELWLSEKGIDWRQFNVNRHRRGDCGCSR
jgi:hypothetical protein